MNNIIISLLCVKEKKKVAENFQTLNSLVWEPASDQFLK